MAKQKVASWYWNVTAILTPAVLVVVVVWMYYSQQVSAYQGQARQVYTELIENHSRIVDLDSLMKETAERVGFDPGDTMARKAEVASTAPQLQATVGAQERTQPREKRSPTLNYLMQAEEAFYGDPTSASGQVHEYAALRRWIRDYETTLRQYIAFKAGQYYTVETIDDTVIAGGNLARPGNPESPIYMPEDSLWRKEVPAGFVPADRVMQAPTRVTLELIFRRQQQLLRQLVDANKRQYGLLYAEVSGSFRTPGNEELWIGPEGESKSAERTRNELGVLRSSIDNRSRSNTEMLNRIFSATRDEAISTSGRANELDQLIARALARADGLRTEFEAEKSQHEADAQRFLTMLTNLPRIKSPSRLEKSDPDGDITYSDYQRGVCHVNLGSADGVKAGQRFEVWRLSGHERDRAIAVIEIVRTLNDAYSLASVLTLVDEKDPVRTGDKVVSLLWHDGRFLTIAMHGDFEAPTQSYSKARLKELLELAGCRVVDRVQPGVDLVILGSNLFSDEWYRDARRDLRFSSTLEENVRLYVDPR